MRKKKGIARTTRALIVMMMSCVVLACQGGARDANASASGSGASPGDQAAQAEGRNTPSSTKRPTVLFIGTSLTAGYGLDDPSTQAFPAQVGRLADSAHHSIRVVNAGVSGETSAGALERVDWLLRQPADIVVLETGANDGLRGLSVTSVRNNLDAIVTRFRAAKPGIPILLVQMEAPPNLGSTYVTTFHDAYGDISKKDGVALSPFLLEGVAGIPSLNQKDGIHPTVQGAGIAAKTVWGALAPLVERWYAQTPAKGAA